MADPAQLSDPAVRQLLLSLLGGREAAGYGNGELAEVRAPRSADDFRAKHKVLSAHERAFRDH